MESDAARLSDVMVALRRVWRRRLRRASSRPLPANQLELLRIVDAHPGIGIAAAARELYLADNSVSTLANRLVTAGLIVRRDDPADGRAACLEVTPAARERIEEWRVGRRKLVDNAYRELAPDDQRAISRALPALQRLLERLEVVEA